ncbi:pyruvate, water dikinase regulatory protein [Metabacillus arenae]|uniref:Putative pyruvate, phosphate dikinase regulatory protein n=1 Tax=Metabacillus arenae TaxID=2771434 RepID=A0A926NPV6_9BACI|nr:pyruvate, water dikinase regulatory protein [Metabacillus arenae]MBD1381741.1 kinase/pyrophosphorylase [Metabacillus arenae]
MNKKENVYIVSDSLDETAEKVVRAVFSISGREVKIQHISYVKDITDIKNVITISKNSHSIIVYTIVTGYLKQYLELKAQEEGVITVDLLTPLMDVFMKQFYKVPKGEPNLIKNIDDDYCRRVEAIEFAVQHDDGQDTQNIRLADIVLIGVSRTSKTPLSMYLAYKGFKVANIPLVPEIIPPSELFKIPNNKCVGLVITPDKLNEIRRERLKNLGMTIEFKYANVERIHKELNYAENLMKRIGCPIIDVSNIGIEETADLIMSNVQKEWICIS